MVRRHRGSGLQMVNDMGDMSKEPSMEEILSSIKRIIAEDADGAGREASGPGQRTPARRDADRESHRKAVVASMAREADDGGAPSYIDEVLELTDEMPRVGRGGKNEELQVPVEVTEPVAEEIMGSEDMADDNELELTETIGEAEPVAKAAKPAAKADTIVSVQSEAAARSSLAALSSLLVKPEAGDNTLEGLVREMLRPMLKEWLDANLPTLVEGMVAKEIARITGRSL